MSGPDVAVAAPTGDAFDQAWESLTPPSEPEAPDAAPPAEPEAAPAAPAQKARDDKGRFASTDKAPPAESAPPEPTEPPPAESTDEQPPAETPVTEGEPQPETEAVYPEFEYTVEGRPLSIPGSKVGEDGIFIPADQSEQVTRLLIAGRTAARRAQDHGRELQAARKSAEVETAKTRAVLQKIKEAHKTNPAGFAEWFQKLDFEKLELQEQVKALSAAKQEVETQYSAAEVERQAQNLVPQLQASVKSALTQYQGKPEFEGVDFDRMYDRLLGPEFDRVFSEDESGIQFHAEYVKELVEYEAAVLARGRKTAAKLAAATKANQPVVQQQAAAKKPAAPAKPKPSTDDVIRKLPTARERIAHVFGEGFKDL